MIQKKWIMNTQHQRWKINNTIKCRGKECKKISVNSFSLKLDWDDDLVTAGDRLFHMFVATTEYAAVADCNVEHFVLGTTSAVIFDRRCHPETTSDARRSSDDRNCVENCVKDLLHTHSRDSVSQLCLWPSRSDCIHIRTVFSESVLELIILTLRLSWNICYCIQYVSC